MRQWQQGLAAAILLAALAGATARADDDKEEKISLDKVPQAVLDAVKAKVKGAKVISAEVEKEHGKLIYEIKLARANQKIEVKVALEIKIIEIEKTIFAKGSSEKVRKKKHEEDDDEHEKKVKKGNKKKHEEDKDDDKEHKKGKKKEGKKKRDKDDD